MKPPENWARARVTLGIAAVTALAWLIVSTIGLDEVAIWWGGFIPARLGGTAAELSLAPFALTPLTSALIHAGFVHLAFNLLILLFCGRAVETIIGPWGMVSLYVIGAYAAAAVHYAVGPQEVIPAVGASGAISAVLGAYAMLFGRNRVKVANPTLALWINALWLAAAWVVLQLIVGITFETGGEQVAIGGHIGGFLAGLILAKPLLLLHYRGA